MNTPFFQLRWQQLHHPALTNSGDELWICHLDCQVQAAAGNKWLKLKYHIRQIQQHGHQGIVTFGGAFSNHLAAVAAAGNALGFTTKAIVRAHVTDLTNPTLQQCVNDGMELIFVEPSIYRKRHEPQFLDTLQSNYPNYLIVPEGGTGEFSLPGFAELNFAQTPNGKANLIVCAAASGGTVAGIAYQQSQLTSPCPILAVQVVKDASLPAKIDRLCPSLNEYWQLMPDISGQKYGSFDQATLAFCVEMAQHGVAIEPVYSGKALRSLFWYLQQHPSSSERRITFFHTGGMQGLKGLHYRNMINDEQFRILSSS